MDETSIPSFPRGVRLRHDETRGQWVLLAPERAFVPDEIGVEILRLVNGETRLGRIIDALAERYAAPREEIAADVLAMVHELAAKRVLRG
ncbi:pyrroloquinoline quinone biosynthesis peptide chaperone PqqD [Lichenicoccus sp.]|uniref:pyrroloquinoline quinone biosynthesis peptide chaperone PqqD n=1 Tax=Lichenicoccus sp. TaxID=2781899 RepID=UPI003D0D431A